MLALAAAPVGREHRGADSWCGAGPLEQNGPKRPATPPDDPMLPWRGAVTRGAGADGGQQGRRRRGPATEGDSAGRAGSDEAVDGPKGLAVDEPTRDPTRPPPTRVD